MATGMRSVAVARVQPVAPAAPENPRIVTDAAFGHELTVLVDQGDVVVVSCPIDPAELQRNAPLSLIGYRTELGARAALMEGLHGPTPDQPFMTSAHRRGPGLHSSGPNGRTSFRKMNPTAGSTHKSCDPDPSAPPRTRRSPNTESDCARPPHRSDPRRPGVRFHIGIGDLAAPLVFMRRRQRWPESVAASDMNIAVRRCPASVGRPLCRK